MANICINSVWVDGQQGAIKNFMDEIKKLHKQNMETGEGVLPDYCKEQLDKDVQRYFFFCDEIQNDAFMYETRWCPNLEVLQMMADHHGVNVVCEYDETGNLVYGKWEYRDKVETDIYLEDADFESYDYDEDKNIYIFEDAEYDSDYEILEILLERKIKQQTTFV